MDNKFKVSDFASIIGCSQKTVYRMIERGELITVNEQVNGRKIVFILANNKQIEEIKKNQASFSVNDGNYEESLSNNVSQNTTNAELLNVYADKLFEMNKINNEQIMKLNEELISFKSRVPLLEDKASREGLYLSEINNLKKNNTRFIIATITLIFLSVLIACVLSVLLVIEHNKPPKVIETEKVIEKVVEKPVYKYIKR